MPSNACGPCAQPNPSLACLPSYPPARHHSYNKTVHRSTARVTSSVKRMQPGDLCGTQCLCAAWLACMQRPSNRQERQP